MESFNFKSSTRIILGKDSFKDVGKYIKPHSSKILLHYEGELIKKLGIYDSVVTSLEENEIEFVELSGVVPNPRLSLVKKGIDICIENDVDFILAIGGGSVIDSSKAISLGVPYNGDVWDFFTGKAEPTKSLKVGVVLTIPGAGSEMSESSIITREDDSTKAVCDTEFNIPEFAILDPQVCYSIPTKLMCCGIVDILSHLMERYFSPTENIELSDSLIEAAMRTIVKLGPKYLENPKDYNTCAEIMWTSTVAHNGMIACGRIADWSSHRIEHEISAIYDLNHGAGMAAIFPAWLKYVKEFNPKKIESFSKNVFNCENGIEALEKFFKSLGLATTLKELNIPEDCFEYMAKKALGSRETMGNYVKLNAKDIINILEIAMGGRKI
ncbi:iron-containing alcohol dehydrogenase [Cetobacterium sp.]|uniref:iron-containing alcohol dehydrogenase n=1 Tax=Cetobacterium sp. TaxID=2071632 RepID=UPI002FC88DC2